MTRENPEAAGTAVARQENMTVIPAKAGIQNGYVHLNRKRSGARPG
ncbi:MAG: hypothetical protein FWH15_04415 [Betaproteobacteria bacterium]|nr:hypothetical protein [Betaproteobacteria bacterium]